MTCSTLRTRYCRALTASALALTGALATGSTAVAQEPIVRDSAGITIVENSPPRGGARPPLQVSARPTLQIGHEGADPAYQFDRIVAVTRGRDGAVIVADQGSSEIRTFDASGRFVGKVGRVGRGPGEFQTLAGILVMENDSLLAWDNIGRFTMFSPQRDSARTFGVSGGPAAEPGVVRLLRGRFRDGTMALLHLIRHPAPPTLSVVRDTLIISLYDRRGAYARPVGRFLGLERLMRGAGTNPRNGREIFGVAGAPFPRETHFRVAADWLYVGTSDSWEILAYDSHGALKRIIRLHEARKPVTPDLIARLRRVPQGENSPARPNVSAKLADSWYPKFLPAYGTIRVDALQRLWVQEYPLPGEAQSKWKVFDPSGKLMGLVATPPGLEVMEIGADYLAGVWRDADMVEHVRIYSLSGGT